MAKQKYTKKELAAANGPAIFQTMVIRPARIESADINTWKTAINSAKRGDRVKLYNLYENLLSDPFLSNAVDKRVNAITNAEIAFLKKGETVEVIDDLIDTPAFENMLREIVLTKGWGKTVIETMFAPEFDIYSYPRKHIKIANLDKALSEHRKFLAKQETDRDGYDYTKDKRFIECGDDYDLGFLYKAAPYVIYKRGGFGDWAQFAEIFGMPFLVGKYNSFDTDSRDKLFEALRTMGSNPVAAIPNEAALEVHENKSSGSTNLYKEFRGACNEEILISALGNTMTTINGSSRSQGEVHKESEEAVNQSDRRYVQRILNRYFLPLLIERGYDAAGGFFVFPDTGKNMSTKDRIDLALTIKNAGIEVSDDYIYDVSGIPKPDKQEKKEDKKNDPKADKPADQEKHAANDTDTPSVVIDIEDLSGHEAEQTKPSLIKRVTRFFVDAPVRWSGAIQNFIGKLTSATTINLADANETPYTIDIGKLFDKALREIYGKRSEWPLIEQHLFEITNKPLQDGISQEFGKMGMEFGEKNEAFIDEFKHNASVFAAFKNHQQTQEIAGLLTDETGRLRPFHEFKKLALGISKDYNENWLRTEYNTAVRSARSAANWKKYEETKDLYPNLEFTESRAANKRPEHLEYVGTILPIDHEWWKTHTPPLAWNCLCGVRPSDKKATEVPIEMGDILPLFQNNPGQTAEFIRIEETPYYKNTTPENRQKIAGWLEELENKFKETITAITNAKTGKTLSISSLHGKEELIENQKIGEFLTANGYSVRLLPLIPVEKTIIRRLLLPRAIAVSKKNPDAVVWNKVFEFKDVSGTGNSVIGNNLSKAAKQSENILLKVNSRFTEQDVMRAINGKIQYWESKGEIPIKRIWFIHNEKLHQHTVRSIKEWAEKQKRPDS